MKRRLVVILAGGATKDKKTGKWRTTKFCERGDNFGVQGDYLRPIAGSYLYKAEPGSILIASGGYGQLKGVAGAPTLATILKNELIKLGIPARRITKEEKSNNTYGQLKAVDGMTIKDKSAEIIFVSNQWHLPRIRAMLKFAPFLRDEIRKAKLISAERVILKYNQKKWWPIISMAYKSRSLKQRIILEKQGIRQIKDGTYKFKYEHDKTNNYKNSKG